MDVAIYLRKSRAEEHEDTAETLRRHKSVLMDYISAHSLSLLRIFEEVVSGESLYARPQMLELLENVESEEYDAVLCMDIDRLGRGGMHDQGIILDTFKNSGTKIITPEKIYDLNDDVDEELTEFKAFMSRREYKLINKRLRRGLMQTISEGCYVANAPYGYSKIYRDRKPTLEINEAEAKFVRMIFDMYCEGVGCTAIANTINSMGAKPHRSNSFGRTSIMHILRNPTFTGKVVWDRKKHIRKGSKGNIRHLTVYQPRDQWTVVDGIHPPIISPRQFELAQSIARSRYIPPSNDGRVKSPLAGLVRCKRCGRNMQRMNMHKNMPYLLCTTKGCCSGTKYGHVENAIIAALQEKLARIEVDMRSTPPVGMKVQEHILLGLKKEIEKIFGQKVRLHTLLEQGVYDVPTYRERMAAVTNKLSALERQAASIEDEIARSQGKANNAIAMQITNVLEAYEFLDAKGRNRLLKTLISHIEYSKEKKTKSGDFCLDIYLKARL